MKSIGKEDGEGWTTSGSRTRIITNNSLGDLGDCKPKFLERTLIWNHAKYQKSYLIKKGGWNLGTRRQVWLDLPAPQHTTAVKFVNPYNKNGPFPVEITNLAQDICFREFNSEKVQQQWRTWLTEKKDTTDRILHYIMWSTRVKTIEEVQKMITDNYPSAATGFDRPVFCKVETQWNAKNAHSRQCNAFFYDSAIKSMPHRPHVQILFLKKGAEDEQLDTATKIGRTCSWNQMVQGIVEFQNTTFCTIQIDVCRSAVSFWVTIFGSSPPADCYPKTDRCTIYELSAVVGR